ncbi:hypothetical protein QOZ80_2BG0156230 [Eleusine coracana subsp. coracana]|nr:hypothetical protein QOZ80_2BG0156230 [Eleusine coracana subsp. coracana]
MSGLVSHLKSITQTLAAETRHHLSVQDIYVLSGLLKKPLEFDKSDNPMGIAVLRIPPASTEKVSVELTESLRGVLLDRVHDLYLKAVSRLPMKEFQTHHHRGLLKAGYCYGPFDPVYNIIVNTIWYNTTFPTSQEFEVDMVCTMRHIESRSLNGLIAFLRASIPQVSEHEAMTYLLKSDLKLCRAIQMAKQEHQTPGSDDEIGYKAAVNASSHPRSEEFLKVVIQTWPKVLSAVRSMMKASHLISSSAIIHLFRLLGTRANLLEPTLKLTKDALDMLSRYKKEFLTQQSIVRAKVEAALKKYGHAQVYWDGGRDFEKISCGEHKITNANIISRGKLIDSDVEGLFEQHYLYLDPIWDCQLISSINQIAWRATLTFEEQFRDGLLSRRLKPQQAE